MNMERRRGLPMLNHVLQQTLRSLCSESQWVYAVFWRILPRNYPPPKWETEGGPVDRSKSNKRNWILVWEDGFCDFAACSAAAANHEATTIMHPDLFFQMSHEVYNYGEGLMGKVAADNSHKWVYREPMEHEISFLSPWHGSLDPHPRTWEGQFKAGIQTIAVISVREGLIQLGSTRKLVEDPNLVILMQRKFNYLHSIPGVFVPHPSVPSPTGIKSNIADQKQQHGSSPYWTDAAVGKDHPLNDGTFMRSNFGSFNNRQFSSQGVLGMKRPADSDIMSNPGRDFPFLSPGINFNRSGSDSTAMASNYGISGSGTSGPQKTPINNALLPSMSSLQNLLSKLPSVTTAPDSNAPTSPGSASAGAARQDHSALPSGLVAQQLELQLNHLDHRNRDHNHYQQIEHELLLRQHQQHQNLLEMDNLQRQLDLDNQARHDHSRQYQQQRQQQLDDYYYHQQQQQQQHRHQQQLQVEVQDEEQNAKMSELLAAVTASRGGDGGPSCSEAISQQAAAAGSKDKLTSFLHSFDEDTLTDLGLHDDLENHQTYNSFRTQII